MRKCRIKLNGGFRRIWTRDEGLETTDNRQGITDIRFVICNILTN